MTSLKLQEALQYRLKNTADLADVLELGENLLKREETDLCFSTCRFAHNRVLELNLARRNREKRLAEIYALRRNKEERALLSDVEKKLLLFEEELLQGLPSYLIYGESALQQFSYKAAQLFVSAAIFERNMKFNIMFKSNPIGIIDDSKLEISIVSVINEASDFLSSPDQLMQLCKVLDNQGFPKLALPVARRAYETQQKIRTELKKKTEIKTEIYLLEEERTRLKRMKKDLNESQLQKLNLLQLKLESFVTPFTGPVAFDDINGFEQELLRMGLIMLGCTINMKKNLLNKKKDVHVKKTVFTEEEKSYVDNPELLTKMTRDVVKWTLDKIHDPSHLLEISKNSQLSDIDFVFEVGKAIREKINDLKKRFSADKEFKKELELLQEEREKQLVLWKFLSDDKDHRLRELERQSHMNKILRPTFTSLPLERLDEIDESVLKYLLDCVFAQSDELEDRILNPRKYPNQDQLSTSEQEAKRSFLKKSALSVIENVEDPQVLFNLAKHTQTRKFNISEEEDMKKTDSAPQHQAHHNFGSTQTFGFGNNQAATSFGPTQQQTGTTLFFGAPLQQSQPTAQKQNGAKSHKAASQNSELIFNIGEKCQKVIRHIEELRATRAPIQTQINNLTNEKEDLISRKRDFEESKQKKLTELQNTLNSLPPWPVYAKLFEPYQYDDLNLDIVRVMTSAILDNKTALEADIARQFRDQPPDNIDYTKIENSRTEIQQKITQLTKQCIEKFENPVSLLKFAKDMKNRKETEVVIDVVTKCLERITKITQLRAERYPLQMRLDKLDLTKTELLRVKKQTTAEEEEIKKLKDQIEKLPKWPHFAQIYQPSQYDKTTFNCIDIILNSVLDSRVEHEALIKKQFYEDRTSVNHDKIKFDRGVKKSQIDNGVKLCIQFITNPLDLQNIIISLVNRKETEVAMEIAVHFFNTINDLEKKFLQKEDYRIQIEVYEEEEKFLESRKKKLATNLKNILEETKEKLEAFELTLKQKFDQRTLTLYDNLKNSIIQQLNASVHEKKKSYSNQILTDIDLTEERKDFLNKTIKENEINLKNLIFTNINNPSSLLEITKYFHNTGQYDFSLTIGKHTFKILTNLRKERTEHEKINTLRKELLKEEAELEKSMKRLDDNKKEELRKIEVIARIYDVKPVFYQSSLNIDDLSLQLAVQLITTTLQQRAVFESENVMRSDDYEKQLQALKNETKFIVELSLDNILEIKNIIQFGQNLFDKKEFLLVILIGKKCQERIEEQKAEFEEREKLKQEFERLDNLRLQYLVKQEESSEGNREEVSKKLEEAKLAISKLPKIADIQAEIDERNRLLLGVIELIFSAAKAEGLEDEMRAQTILAFKADTTTARWDQIRRLTPENEWEQVKQDLVVYVIQQNINPLDKVELLLKDGLYKQVLEVFPKPTGKKSELDLLLKVYLEIETKEPEVLEHMLVVVTRYIKRWFQEQKYKEVYPILDRLQKRFPSMIINIFSKAVEMVMFNLMQSQYSNFVNMLKDLKRRMELLNRQDEWNNFLSDFKRTHKGKQKLIQMVSLIGDSSWDLATVMGVSKKSKRDEDEIVATPTKKKKKSKK